MTMKITVNDCLSLESLTPSVLAAGRKNIENRVRSVSVLDVCDSTSVEDLKDLNEQLLLTSFSGVDDTSEKCKIVESVARKGASGLIVFHLKKGLTSLEKTVVETAEKNALPLVAMPDANPSGYADVIEQVVDKLLYGSNFKNSLINNTIYHLLDFERHSSFQSALKEAAVSNEFQLVLLSRDFNPILTVETRQRTTIADAIRLGKERDVDKSSVYTFIDVNGVLTYWGSIKIDNEKYFLFLVDNEDNYSAGEITKLAEIIELAIGMWKYTPERDVKAEFVKALIRSNKSLAYALKDEMELPAENIMSVFYYKGVETSKCNSIISDFEMKENAEVIRLAEGSESYGVIIKKGDAPSDEVFTGKAAVLGMYEKLKEDNKALRVFHVTGINGIEGAADAFHLIVETWTFVESVFPYKRVFTKYELSLASNCVNIQIQNSYLKKTYMELLEPFKREMGENKAKQLLETLETFVLDAGLNSGKTSVFMGIHTNTVQYRLKRINEVLGAEMTGNRIIPGLTIALAQIGRAHV